MSVRPIHPNLRSVGGPALLLLLAACPAASPQTTPGRAPAAVPEGVHDRAPAPSVQSLQAPRLVVVPSSAARPDTTAAVAFAETAATEQQRKRGLMGRDHLEPDHGMLFVYRSAVSRSFWMKDCTTGLDIAFIRPDGTISRVATLPPGAGLPNAQVPSAESGGPVLWVLEMETGWFARMGIREGDRVDVASAVAGIDPE